MSQHQKHVRHLEANSRYGKEIDGDQLLEALSRKVRQVCDGGLRQRTMYLLTLVSPMSMPSLSNSPWMRGAPQVGFSRHILRIRSRTSRGSVGLPGWPRRILHAQKRRKLLRCQAMTVSG